MVVNINNKQIEIPNEYQDFSYFDIDENGFNIELYNKRKEKYLKQYELQSLYSLLSQNDHKGQKYLDGEYTDEEWAEIVAQRKEWRKQTRELEKELN